MATHHNTKSVAKIMGTQRSPKLRRDPLGTVYYQGIKRGGVKCKCKTLNCHWCSWHNGCVSSIEANAEFEIPSKALDDLTSYLVATSLESVNLPILIHSVLIN